MILIRGYRDFLFTSSRNCFNASTLRYPSRENFEADVNLAIYGKDRILETRKHSVHGDGLVSVQS